MTAWFRKKPSPTPPDAESHEQLHKSLALNALFHQLREDRKYRVLDLGPAVGRNIEFFSQFRCKLQIEDLFETFSSFDYFAPEDGFSYEAVFSYLLPFSRSTTFDVILAWDVPNYLDRQVLLHLVRHLSRFSRPGTLLFALIATGKHIPETPHRFEIVDEETLLYGGKTTVLRSGPQYDASDLSRLMPGFRVCNSFVLRNGYREYLMVYEAR